MFISNDIRYIGVNDHETDLFEGQFAVPDGMAYNSYLLLDEKIAVLDTVDGRFAGEWLEKLETALAGRQPDYLVLHHVEPDHSSSLAQFLPRWPETEVVAGERAFPMLAQFYGGGLIRRAFNAKYPREYIDLAEKRSANLAAFADFYREPEEHT